MFYRSLFLFDEGKYLENEKSSFLIALLEQEKQRIEELTAGWDDPTAVDWDNEEKDEVRDTSDIPSSQPIYKCTALYSYTVSCATQNIEY